MTGLDLSVLIVSHGHADLVRACLASLPQGLDGLRYEVFVTDNLAEAGFAERIGGAHPWLTLIVNDRPMGFGANMNQAATRARGRVLLILNPDTQYHAGRVADAVAFLEADDSRGIVAACLLNEDLTEQRNFRQFPSAATVAMRILGADGWKKRPAFYRRAMLEGEPAGTDPVDWVYGSFMLIRRATFAGMGGFDTGYFMYYEDVDLCHRMRRTGLSVHVVPGLAFVHRHLRTSAAEKLGSHRKHHVASVLRYLARSHGWVAAPRFAPLAHDGPPRARRLAQAAFAVAIFAAIWLASLATREIGWLFGMAGAPFPVTPAAIVLTLFTLLTQFMLQEFDPQRLGDTVRRVTGAMESCIMATFPTAFVIALAGPGVGFAGAVFLVLSVIFTGAGAWLFSRSVHSDGARVGVVTDAPGQVLPPVLPIGQQIVAARVPLTGDGPAMAEAAVADLLRRDRIDHVLLLLGPGNDAAAMAFLRDMRMYDVPVWHAVPHEARGQRILQVRTLLRSRAREALKRGLDLVFSLGALTILALPMMLVALAIKAEDRGPVFFAQTRSGRNQVPFRMLKFRSMYAAQGDENADRLTTRNDARITRVGAFIRKTSLDELPQLLNVVRGDMSVVGPRPLPVGFHFKGQLFETLVPMWHHRGRVRPGITGLSQVRGLRGTPDTIEDAARMMSDRVFYDNLYIDHWTIWLDLRILVMTVVTGAFVSGAY